jgi:endonuclease/exonuclease/phosphatase family metal-dependent hydrolase
MKNLSLGYKIAFIINNVFALLLLLSYLTVFISPAVFPVSGVLNFSIPILWIINALFVILWLLKLKRQLILSVIVMALGWFQLRHIFVIPSQVKYAEKGIKVMSYNVMQFYSKTDKRKSTYLEISEFINNENIDVLCFQEYNTKKENLFPEYIYRTPNNDSNSINSIILSKYPIIKYQNYGFGISNNSGVFADITINSDTIRVFSVHFESLNIRQDADALNSEPKDKLVKRLSKTFERQINQLKESENDILNSPFPVVLAADMNNTALSHLYRGLKNLHFKDTFVESGQYYGKTYSFFELPVRIDMIFIDEGLKSIDFKNYNIDFSDHEPVMAEIGL